MHGIRNSKRSRSSKPRPPGSRNQGSPAAASVAGEYAAIAIVLAAIGLGAALAFHRAGFVLYYGDAEAHLNIARRIVDSRTPGYEQIGTVWLPLSHALMLPFVGSMRLWQTGWAATIPGVACFVLAGVMLFAAARTAYGSSAAGACAALVLALNPNLLYLQSTAMNEPVFLAMQIALLFFSLRFARTQSTWTLAAAGLFAAAGALTRYEGWFLLPFVALYIFTAATERPLRAMILFCAIAGAAPVYWLIHNGYIYSNPLEFFNGPHSPKAIQGAADYPGKGNWLQALEYYKAAAILCIGVSLGAVAVIGVLPALFKRALWPLIFLSLTPLFYVVSMVHSGGTPIFIPHLPPNSYYNTRYGLCVLPLAAFAAGAIVAVLPRGWRPAAAVAVVLIAVTPWIVYPRPDSWITWKEAAVNHAARREWTAQAADYMREHYRPGGGILVSFGDDVAGVFRLAGIPLREALHHGNGVLAAPAFVRPDLFLHEEWAMGRPGDTASEAMLKLIKSGSPYTRVKLIEVRGATPFEIFRRIRPMPKP
jgi:hypothetical protein